MDKITEWTKLIVTIGCVLIGVANLIIFPIIDCIYPDAHIIQEVQPILKQVLDSLK